MLILIASDQLQGSLLFFVVFLGGGGGGGGIIWGKWVDFCQAWEVLGKKKSFLFKVFFLG